MAFAVRIVQGKLGRVALFELDNSLGAHAHSQWHILIKCDGADSAYSIRNRTWPLSEKRAVLVNSWEPHKYIHPIGAPPSTMARRSAIRASSSQCAVSRRRQEARMVPSTASSTTTEAVEEPVEVGVVPNSSALAQPRWGLYASLSNGCIPT